jgi:hypothetical protein
LKKRKEKKWDGNEIEPVKLDKWLNVWKQEDKGLMYDI